MASAADIAGRQWGVIGARQLRACGVTSSTAGRWLRTERLHVIHHTVYTLGHRFVPVEGHLVGALLYAGRDAVLSHRTAAWWWGLVPEQPPVIEVTAPRRVRRSNGIVVHRRKDLEPTRHRRFPITTVPQTLLDYAATANPDEVRRALAQADYRRLLDPEAVRAVLGQGRAGTARLRAALERHEPRLARTRSWLEEVFIPLCESAGIPLPEINVRVAGWTVAALWRQERLVVELDGYDNHSTRGQMERDRRKELELRAAGFLVIRYTSHQVTEQPELVAADLLARLQERRGQLSSTALST
jgi:hypothetical protein